MCFDQTDQFTESAVPFWNLSLSNMRRDENDRYKSPNIAYQWEELQPKAEEVGPAYGVQSSDNERPGSWRLHSQLSFLNLISRTSGGISISDEIFISFPCNGSVDCRFCLSVRGIADEIYIYNSIVFGVLHWAIIQVSHFRKILTILSFILVF